MHGQTTMATQTFFGEISMNTMSSNTFDVTHLRFNTQVTTNSSIPELSLILAPSNTSNVDDGILSHKGADSQSPDFMSTSEMNSK